MGGGGAGLGLLLGIETLTLGLPNLPAARKEVTVSEGELSSFGRLL